MTGFQLKVEVSPSALEMKPGDSAQVMVRVTNVSDIVEHYQPRIAGLPSDDYWSVEPQVTKLRPGESDTLKVVIRLPVKGGLMSGQYPLSVVVASPHRPAISPAADLALDVGAVSGITMEAKPTTLTGKREALFAVALINDGNIDVPVTIQASDDRGQATITATYQSGRQPAPTSSQIRWGLGNLLGRHRWPIPA